MKRLACIVLALSSATLLCCPMDPDATKSGRRALKPRLSGAQWGKYCAPAKQISTCTGSLSRARALELLPDADDACLDHVLEVIKTQAPEELSAAYFIRAERNEDPVDYLRALDAAKTPFNRALAQERLGLKAAAIQSWDEVVKANEPGWAAEAKKHRDRLNQPDPGELWSIDQLEAALRRRDAAAVQLLVKDFPLDTMRYFEESDLLNIETSRMFAKAFKDPYPRDIVDAAQRTTDRNALEQGLHAFRQARAFQKGGDRAKALRAFERAATLLERAGNPLFLGASYEMAATGEPSLPLLDIVAMTAEKHGYRDIAGRVHALRGSALDWSSRYLDAQAAYARALEFTKDEPATMVAALARRSENYATLGNAERAFRDFFVARQHLPRVADLNAVHHAYGAAAMATWKLGYPAIALRYQEAALRAIQGQIAKAPAAAHAGLKLHLAVALRRRADIYLALGDDGRTAASLREAAGIAQSADLTSYRDLLNMRIQEVHGRILLKQSPKEAVQRLTDAIKLGAKQDSTYRAVLYHQRALARRNAGDSGDEKDIAVALEILRDEATLLLEGRPRGAFEELWRPYFSRFQSMYHDMIVSHIAAGDREGAFVYAEEARAFEPMHLLLRAKSVPEGFLKIESAEDLHRARAGLPEDMVILQYLVLDDKTYTWAISSDRFDLFVRDIGRETISRWTAKINDAVKSGQSFQTQMRAAYALFASPLATFRQPRILIVPDGPMHGLPFAALQRPDGKYLIERASIAVAGSTSLYLYARARDRELASQCNPRVVIVGEPKIDPRRKLAPLPYAVEEAQQLARDYPGAKVLVGAEATTGNFLADAKDATIIHFAGHAVADPQNPWKSRLMLAPDEGDEGDLTAEELLKELPDLVHTRFIALSACRTASGQAGPEGLAPLVRPLIAARVPAVVGTLWDVRDATTKNLLVSLHRHYRNGDDVAVALQKAQRDMLRRNVPARLWAPFQVVGYAGSPYERPAANGGTRSERVCAQNSLYRPDGLHPQ